MKQLCRNRLKKHFLFNGLKISQCIYIRKNVNYVHFVKYSISIKGTKAVTF